MSKQLGQAGAKTRTRNEEGDRFGGGVHFWSGGVGATFGVGASAPYSTAGSTARHGNVRMRQRGTISGQRAGACSPTCGAWKHAHNRYSVGVRKCHGE